METGEKANMIFVNGSPKPWNNAPLKVIVETCVAPISPMPPRGIAVALNGEVVPRRDWETIRPAAGDRLEIVRPMAGG